MAFSNILGNAFKGVADFSDKWGDRIGKQAVSDAMKSLKKSQLREQKYNEWKSTLAGKLDGVEDFSDEWLNILGEESANYASNRLEKQQKRSDFYNKLTSGGTNGWDVAADFMSGLASGGLKAGLQSAGGGIAALGGDLMAKWGQKAGASKYGENITSEQNAVRGGIRSAIASFGPIGWGISAATGAVDAIGAATGTELSNIDKDAASRAGIKGVGVQNTLNYVPALPTLIGAAGAATGIKRTDSFGMSDEAEEMSSGYAGTVNDMRAAEQLGNKRFLIRNQTNKANGFINDAKVNNELLANLNVTNTMRKQSDYYQDLAHQNLNRYAGENYLGMRMGRKGLVLPSVEEIRAILVKRGTEKLQNGGTIGIDSNVLPSGSLHARLNHLDEVNPELEDATKKGIPVMAVENGEIVDQVAEIERDELILRLEVTKQLEELMQDGSEEAMLEAGKLLASEIIENTQDNTGQITEEVEDGK